MTQDQVFILGILLITVTMFLRGRWRHDMVAATSLLACVLAGLVPPREAFAGFGHPAVITVACVLVLSRGLQNSGAIDALARVMLPEKAGRLLSMSALVGLGAVLSSFMNNVGAMALLMPVAIKLAGRLALKPGQVLMPLAFGTILGGMTTLIGTPPNLIVSAFRAQTGIGGFAMFDFTPVGLAVAACGVLFIALLGWRLVPARQQSGVEGFESGAYMTEVRVPEENKTIGLSLREIEATLGKHDAQIVGLVRNEVRMIAPYPGRRVRAGDILILETEADSLAGVLSALDMQLEETRHAPEAAAKEHAAEGAEERQAAERMSGENGTGAAPEPVATEEKSATVEEIVLMELAVLPGSALTGRSATDLRLRMRYGLNLLAISRQGQRSVRRLRSALFQSGDLLLMQGSSDAILEFAGNHGCVPLAERELRIPDKRKAWAAGLIMAFAVGVAAFGLIPAAISFAMGVVASMALRTVPPRLLYSTIDWPVIILLGALIPVASAMESTGTADLIARFLLERIAQGEAVFGLALILIVTMFLSDLMNNAATAAVMCPIAIGAAGTIGVSPDSFLMAVAIGASCAFLTPIGHQNNTLILGPGGFRFSDYWRLGLPLEILVIVISIPLLLLVWPL